LKTIKAFLNLIDGVQNQKPNTKEADEENSWFLILQTKMNMQKQIVGTNFVWKIAFKHTVEDYK
jgi:hypothetical protein